ncbi:unnamed protein product, partial [Scytosiphon promiscuus]
PQRGRTEAAAAPSPRTAVNAAPSRASVDAAPAPTNPVRGDPQVPGVARPRDAAGEDRTDPPDPKRARIDAGDRNASVRGGPAGNNSGGDACEPSRTATSLAVGKTERSDGVVSSTPSAVSGSSGEGAR